MQIVYENFNQIKRQCHSEKEMIKIQDIKKQIANLQRFKIELASTLLPSDLKDINHYIKVYKLAAKQIDKMKMQFTKPSLLKSRLNQIFDNQKQQFTLEAAMERTSIRSSQIQIPTYNKNILKENVIDSQEKEENLESPGLKSFFEKKEAELMNRSKASNFKSVLQTPQNKSFSKSNNRSVSRQLQNHISRSRSSSFIKRNLKQQQLKKILQENRRIKQEYDKRIKRELQLSEFEKALLKQEKNRYMMKIQELQSELQNLYRMNYRLKQQVTIKQKQLKEKSGFQSSASLGNMDENLNGGIQNRHDYYQPYVMRTKHNDLKRLNIKNKSQEDDDEIENRNYDSFFNQQKIETQGLYRNEGYENSNVQKNKAKLQPVVDLLGNQLDKQLKELQKERSRSNHSHFSSKKWSRDYNPSKYQQNSDKANQEQELIRVLRQDDEEDLKISKSPQNNSKALKNTNFAAKPQSQAHSKQFKKKQNNVLRPFKSQPNTDPYFLKSQPQDFSPYQDSRLFQKQQKSIQYKPQSNYSFTNAVNRDYSLQSSQNNFDTFQMTRTYLNFSQNQEQSQTNKYIDSRTSTRNKVAFFKDSLILIKNEKFELAFKRSSLVHNKDRIRVIFFVKNKTAQAITINFKYEYDASYFKLKVNEKLETVPAYEQARQDLEVYAFSSIDLNEVIDIMVEVDFEKYGLWMPILWIEFEQNENFCMPPNYEEISIIPDRQFKSYETAKTVMPVTFGGISPTSQWAYLYGKCKFGPCYIKLTWDVNQLKIQTNSKWIDLLAFVMHHVK